MPNCVWKWNPFGAPPGSNALTSGFQLVPSGRMRVTVTAVPVAGAAVTGTRLSEDTFTLAVRDTGGRNHVFVKTSLKDIRKEPKKSAMPSYRDRLSADELQDLIAYLASLKEPS